MTSESREQKVQSILHSYLQARDRGESPDREALLDAHPDLREELAKYFADASKLDALAKSLKTAAYGGESTEASPSLGKVRYFGDYELLREIARGGMGVVFKAKQVSLNRVVALKMILKGEFASEADVRRFRQEAEAAANLDHPNIVPIYEVGEHEGQQYFSMKLIETAPVSRDLRGSAATLAKVARAVHHAHQRGILHRDLKPSNILIDKQGEPHVADFGLAKKVEGGEDATKSGAIVGTPAYMAPEQARAEKSLTTAVDVYSLGAILYEWLTGRPPFRGEDALSTLMQVVNDEPAKPRSLNGRIDRDLETICLKCLEKDPTQRYGSAESLAEDLERWQRGDAITARGISHFEQTLRWCRRNKLVTVACLIAAFGIGLAGVLAVRGQLQEEARLKAALHEAKEQRRTQLIQSAKFARLSGDRGSALQSIVEAFKDGSGNEEALATEAFLSLATSGLRHRSQSQLSIGNLTPPYLAFSPDSSSVFLEYGGTRTILSVPATKEVRQEDAPNFRLLAAPPEFKMPAADQWFVRAVNTPVTFALLSRRAKPDAPLETSLWDIAQQKFIGALPRNFEATTFMAISADGRLAAFNLSGAVNVMLVWDFKEGKVATTLVTGNEVFPLRYAAGFSPNGRLLAVHGKIGPQSSLLVFEVNTGRLLGSVPNFPLVSAWSPDGRWLASWGRGKMQLEPGAVDTVDKYRQDGNTANVLLMTEVVHPVTNWQAGEKIDHLEFSKDGRFLAADNFLLRTLGGKQWMGLERLPEATAHRIAFRTKASGSAQFAHRIRGVSEQKQAILSHPGFTALPFARKDRTTVPRLSQSALHPDGNHAAVLFFLDRREDHPTKERLAPTEYSLEWWDIAAGKRLAILNTDSLEKFATCDSALSGEAVITTSDLGVKLWDVKTGKIVRHHTLPVQSSSSGGWHGDIKDGAAYFSYYWSGMQPVVLGPGGEHALVMTRRDINDPQKKPNHYDRVNLRTGARRGTFVVADYNLLALSADGRFLAEVSTGGIRLHDLDTSKSLSWDSLGGDVTALAFHPRGEVLATADSAGMVRLWHLAWIQSEAEMINLPLPGLAGRNEINND